MTAPLSWDYTHHASSYDARADYCADLLDQVLQGLHLPPKAWALEVGAGTGKLSGHLLRHCQQLAALEPNAAMRALAVAKPELSRIAWIAALGEQLPLRQSSVDLIAYGSSFNVLPPQAALSEAGRVLKSGGHWLALWNHRDLADPLQQRVEAVIRHHLPHFDSGTRRTSPAGLVQAHGGFTDLRAHEQGFSVTMPSSEWLRAWRAHATLQRQAGDRLSAIIQDIGRLLAGRDTLQLPYVTRVWTARNT